MDNKKLRQKLNKLPKSPGIYFFKNNKKEIIYVGKATRLKERVRQYFSTREPGERVAALKEEIADISWQKCQSEIDALIEEAKNIKKYRPKFNVLLRDDKNYFFVAITKETFPRIFITHQPAKIFKADFIGPFTEGKSLKQVLKILRKIYPYCACKTHAKRPCLQYHLGLCLGPSIHPERKKAIRQNISAIKQILNGKRQTLLKKMKSQMMESAKKENFIKAEELKNKIKSLENIFAHRLFLGVDSSQQTQAQRWDKAKSSLQIFLKSEKEIHRVEGYDISNIGGQYAVGSMVVFENGEPNKSQYRKFKIKYSGTEPNDPKMMAEILTRRVKHTEWPAPDLIIVDGGITQLNAARSVLPKSQPVISLAKKEEEIYAPNRPPIHAAQLGNETKLFLQHLRDEAHRFAIAYHRKLRSASFK